MFFNNLLMFVFLLCMLFSFVYSAFFIVLYIVSPSVYDCLFPIFVCVYRPLPQGRNPTEVNKCHYVSNKMWVVQCSVSKNET
jgi:hypothetical protein